MFLLVPAHPGSPGQRVVKRLLLLLCSRRADCGVMSADEVLHSLKTELERCLKKCQDKSQQITKLQAELKTCRATLAENDVALELAQKELQSSKNKVTVSHLVASFNQSSVFNVT